MPQTKAPPRPSKSRKPLSRRERALRRRARNEARAPIVAPECGPDDIDALRYMVARRIAMFIGNRCEYWRSCREPCCRRARACIAPAIACSNAPPRKPDPDGRRAARGGARGQRLFRQALERAEEGRGT